MKKSKVEWNKICSIVLKVVGGLTLLYFLYALYVSCDYIGSLASTKQIEVNSDFGKIIQYVMTQSFSYLFYGTVFLFMGFVLPGNNKIKKDEEISS